MPILNALSWMKRFRNLYNTIWLSVPYCVPMVSQDDKDIAYAFNITLLNKTNRNSKEFDIVLDKFTIFKLTTMTNKWLIGYWHCGTICSRIGLYLPSPSSISNKIVFSVHILMQCYMYIFSITGEFKIIHIYGRIRQVTLKKCVIMLSWNNPIPSYPVFVSRGCIMTSKFLYYWHFVCFFIPPTAVRIPSQMLRNVGLRSILWCWSEQGVSWLTITTILIMFSYEFAICCDMLQDIFDHLIKIVR